MLPRFDKRTERAYGRFLAAWAWCDRLYANEVEDDRADLLARRRYRRAFNAWHGLAARAGLAVHPWGEVCHVGELPGEGE